MAVSAGRVRRVNGPVIEVEGLETGDARPRRGRRGEAPRRGDRARRRASRPFRCTSTRAASVRAIRSSRPGSRSGRELGPGLLGGVYDGMLRRLSGADDMLRPGERPGDARPREALAVHAALARRATWSKPGAILGEAPESEAITFRALVPHGLGGAIDWIAPAGEYTVSRADRPRRGVGDHPRAPVAGSAAAARPRAPSRRRARCSPGQRALDLFFPIARGSSAAVPGGFGTGKTVLLQQIAKWCDADVIVYVGCGERGNEMADVLEEMAQLDDPRTGPLAARPHGADRQHVEHARARARGEHLHGRRPSPSSTATWATTPC